MSDLLFKELYKKCLRFMGIRLRSEKEIRDKIGSWMKKDAWAYGSQSDSEEVDSSQKEAIERVVAQLKKDRFLDDRRFAEEWISSRMRSKPRGEVILRMELAQKGIDRHMIEDVLEEVLHSSGREDPDTNAIRAMAFRVGQKYIKKLQNEDERAFKFKMSQALARKGFDGSVIKSVVDELLVKRYNTGD